MSRPLRLAVRLGVFGAAWLGLHLAIMLADGVNDELAQADVAVVLGNLVERDGTPSPRLRARLDRTLRLYEAGYFDTILVTGGISHGVHSEARVMRDYLVAHGVPADRVDVHEGGVNTYESARFLPGYLAQHGAAKPLIITHYYHLARTKAFCWRFGVAARYSARADWAFERTELWHVLREVPAFYLFMLAPWAG